MRGVACLPALDCLVVVAIVVPCRDDVSVYQEVEPDMAKAEADADKLFELRTDGDSDDIDDDFIEIIAGQPWTQVSE
jgi:hypothetical protein